MKKIRVFYMEGLRTPLVQNMSGEVFQTLKKESSFNDWIRNIIPYCESKFAYL